MPIIQSMVLLNKQPEIKQKSSEFMFCPKCYHLDSLKKIKELSHLCCCLLFCRNKEQPLHGAFPLNVWTSKTSSRGNNNKSLQYLCQRDLRSRGKRPFKYVLEAEVAILGLFYLDCCIYFSLLFSLVVKRGSESKGSFLKTQ